MSEGWVIAECDLHQALGTPEPSIALAVAAEVIAKNYYSWICLWRVKGETPSYWITDWSGELIDNEQSQIGPGVSEVEALLTVF